MDFYSEIREIIDPLSTGGLQWKARQPLSEENSLAILDEINNLISELERAKTKIPFTIHQTLESYIDQVMILLPDIDRSQARNIVNYLLKQNFSVNTEQAMSALNTIN